MGSACSSSTNLAKQAHVTRSERGTRKRGSSRDGGSESPRQDTEESPGGVGVGENDDLNTAQIVAEIDDIPEGIVRSKSPRKFERYPFNEILKKQAVRRSMYRKRAYQLLYRLATPPEQPIVPSGEQPPQFSLDSVGAEETNPVEVVVDTQLSSDEEAPVQSEASLVGIVDNFPTVGRDPHLNTRRERFNRKRHALKVQQIGLKPATDTSDGLTAEASESGSSHSNILSTSDSVARKKSVVIKPPPATASAAVAILSSAKTANDIVDFTRDLKAGVDRKRKERLVTFVLVDDREHAAKLFAASQTLAEKYGALDVTSMNNPWMEITDGVPPPNPVTANPVRILQPQHLPGLLKPEPISVAQSRFGHVVGETEKNGEVKITRSQSGRIISLTTRRTTINFSKQKSSSSFRNQSSIVNQTTHPNAPELKLQLSELSDVAKLSLRGEATLPTFNTSFESEGDSDDENILAKPKSSHSPLAASISRHDSLERIRRKHEASFLSGDGLFSDKQFKDALEMSTVLQDQFTHKMGGSRPGESPRGTPSAHSLSSSFQSASFATIPKMFAPVSIPHEASFSFVSGDAPAYITSAATASSSSPDRYRIRVDTNRPPMSREDPLSGGSLKSPLSGSASIRDAFTYDGIRTPSMKSFQSEFGSPSKEAPPQNADPETLDEWNMIQHEKQNYASLVHQVLGTSAIFTPVGTPRQKLGSSDTSTSKDHNVSVSDLIRSTCDAPLSGANCEGNVRWLEEETITVNEEVINELDKMLQNTHLRNAPQDEETGEEGDENMNEGIEWSHVQMNTFQNNEGPTFVYHFSAPPVAFLSEEMERELAQRAERRKRRAVLLRQMAAAQARLKQREMFLSNRLQKDAQ